jgi:hypothetical protein
MALDGIRKLCSMTTCSGGVVSLLRSPSGGHVRGRGEREEEEAGSPGREETHVDVVCVLLLPGALLYIVGRGAACPSSKPPKAAAKEGPRAAARVRVGLGCPAPTYYPKTLTLAI